MSQTINFKYNKTGEKEYYFGKEQALWLVKTNISPILSTKCLLYNIQYFNLR